MKPTGRRRGANAHDRSPPGTIYTCPMHPEVRQDHPGTCPKCGMALEPELPGLDDGENPELVDFRRRFWWSLPLTVAVTVLAMSGHRLQLFGPATQSWVELVLATPVVLWAAGRSSCAPFSSVAQPQPQHVDPDRPRHVAPPSSTAWSPRSRPASSRRRSSTMGRVAGVLRGCRGHRHADAARAGARAPGTCADRRRDPGRCSASPRPRRGASLPTGARRTCRWRTSLVGDSLRVRPGREGAGRRRRGRGQQRGRRVDADRRADAGRQAARATSVIGGDDEHDRRAGDARRVDRLATPCSRRSSRWSRQAQRSRAPMQRMADRVAGLLRRRRDRHRRR